MKKFMTISLVAALSAAMLTGCGTSKKAAEATTESATVTVDYSVGLNDDGTLADADAEKLVTVAEYKKISLDESDVEVTDDSVSSQIDTLLANFTTTKEVKDRAVKDGDTVNIDYTGTVDGEEFDGGSAEGYDLEIGSGTFIDDFEDQLIGKKPGDTVTVKVTFPDDYSTEDLQGKDAEFETVINYISEEETPELTDEFVKENSSSLDDATTVKELKQKVRDELEEQKMSSALWDYLLKESTFKDIPSELTDNVLDLVIDQMKYQAQSYGIEFDTYLTYMGLESEDAVREQYEEQCEQTVKQYLIADVIAEKEGIEVSEEDMQEFLGTDDISSYQETYGTAYIKRAVLNSLVIDMLEDNVTVTKTTESDS